MSGIDLTVKELRFLKERLKPMVQRAMADAGRQSVGIIQQVSADKVRGFTGMFNKSWKGAQVAWNKYRVLNDAPYARPVELGRRPGARQPPVLALEPWVARVLRVAPEHVRAVAFMVARAIKRRGIRGRFIIPAAEPAMTHTFYRCIMLEIDHELERFRDR